MNTLYHVFDFIHLYFGHNNNVEIKKKDIYSKAFSYIWCCPIINALRVAIITKQSLLQIDFLIFFLFRNITASKTESIN